MNRKGSLNFRNQLSFKNDVAKRSRGMTQLQNVTPKAMGSLNLKNDENFDFADEEHNEFLEFDKTIN